MNFRELRKNMIVITNSIEKLQAMTMSERGTTSREIAAAFTSTQLAMMWTGKFMESSKTSDNPYAKHDGNRKSVEDIEPLFDATKARLDEEIFKQGIIYTIDQIREYLDKQGTACTDFLISTSSSPVANPDLSEQEEALALLALINIYKNITEARMWLGMELGRIRDLGK